MCVHEGSVSIMIWDCQFLALVFFQKLGFWEKKEKLGSDCERVETLFGQAVDLEQDKLSTV